MLIFDVRSHFTYHFEFCNTYESEHNRLFCAFCRLA